MSRSPRIQSKTGIYHIMLRGVNRRQLFFDEEDFCLFTDLLNRYKTVCGFELYAYCLMGNHVHLLLKEGREDICTLFKRFGASFAYWYNGKYERAGHIFQGRYKSEPVETQHYLLTVLRYILRNPVAAGICSTPQDYPYSSAGEYLSGKHGITDTAPIFKMYDSRSLGLYILEDNADSCLEIETSVRKHLTDPAAMEIIFKEFGTLTPEPGTKKDRPVFSESVKKVFQAGVSIRQMSRLTGISKGILQECSKS